MSSYVEILCLKDGLSISHNEPNYAYDVETIFGFDINKNLIKTFTYPTNMNIVNADINKEIREAKRIIINKGCLFYSFRYQISYGHFICQTLPKLLEYINEYNKDPTCKLLVPKHHHNKLTEDIFRLCNIPQSNIVLLEDKYIYVINNYIYTKRHECFCGLSEEQYGIFSLLRNAIKVTPSPIHAKRRIYLKKDGASNATHGNSETGITRTIINENELIEKLKNIGFEIIVLGDKLISEKYELLKDAEYIITQIGANCFNFIFSNAPANLILLSNNIPIGQNWYPYIVSALNNTNINYKLLCYPSYKLNADPKNDSNDPFIVNIDEIVTHIKT